MRVVASALPRLGVVDNFDRFPGSADPAQLTTDSTNAALPFGSGAHAVVEVDDAVPESALIQELKPSVHLIRQCALPAADEDRV